MSAIEEDEDWFETLRKDSLRKDRAWSAILYRNCSLEPRGAAIKSREAVEVIAVNVSNRMRLLTSRDYWINKLQRWVAQNGACGS
jgi:hypothetical protein